MKLISFFLLPLLVLTILVPIGPFSKNGSTIGDLAFARMLAGSGQGQAPLALSGSIGVQCGNGGGAEGCPKTHTPTPTNTPTSTPAAPTDTPTNTPTDTPTVTPTETPCDCPTETPTDTPTSTPTETPTGSPTPTDTPTPTVTACVAQTETADFSKVGLGASVQGLGVVARDLNIKARAPGTAVRIGTGQEPFVYRGLLDDGINSNLAPAGGFSDRYAHTNGLAHGYTFTFSPGVSVTSFHLHMLDFGDLNTSLDTVHLVIFAGRDSTNKILVQQTLSYTSNASDLPNTSNKYGNLQRSGDATAATPGKQPGNWNWSISGKGIFSVTLQFPRGYDPNIGFDGLKFVTECP